MAKVLVTGASGLLGANIVCHLNRRGYDVRILVRSTSNLSGIQDCKYEKFIGDITNVEELKNAIKGCDYVIHAAALTAQVEATFERFWQVNVRGTENIVKEAKKHNIKRFIYVSTANCFTPGPLDQPGTEESGFMPWLIKSPYAYTKFAAQLTVLNEYRMTGFPSIVVAPTFLIGPRDVKPSSGRMIIYVLGRRVIFYTSGGKSFVDVEKVAEAVVNALERGRLGEVYLLSGVNMSYRHFFQIVAEVEGKKKLYVKVPDVLLTSVAGLLTLLGNILGKKFAFDIVNKRLFTLDNYFSHKKAMAELGYEPTVIREAVRKSIAWFRQNGKA